MYDTKQVNVRAEDGTELTLTVPAELPSDDRAEYLRRIFDSQIYGIRVAFLDCGDWKGRVEVTAKSSLANDAVEAMEFFGALVDTRVECTGTSKGYTKLFSAGYYAHGF